MNIFNMLQHRMPVFDFNVMVSLGHNLSSSTWKKWLIHAEKSGFPKPLDFLPRHSLSEILQIPSIGFLAKTPILQAFSRDSFATEKTVIHNQLSLFN